FHNDGSEHVDRAAAICDASEPRRLRSHHRQVHRYRPRPRAGRGLRRAAAAGPRPSAMGTFLWYPLEDRTEPDPRMLELFGLPADGSVSLPSALATLIHPQDRDRYAAAVAQAIDADDPGELRQQIRVPQPDGGVRWLAVTARVAFQQGRPLRMAGVVAD